MNNNQLLEYNISHKLFNLLKIILVISGIIILLFNILNNVYATFLDETNITDINWGDLEIIDNDDKEENEEEQDEKNHAEESKIWMKEGWTKIK
ncbi:MAG: hypothetical protein ACR2F1_07945 [Nitrososphaeraceae archaeon]